MIAWLWGVLVGRFCTHQWEVLQVSELVDGGGECVGALYHLRCARCGDVRGRKVSGGWMP